MKPTWVRATSDRRGRGAGSGRDPRPGHMKPLHETVTRWVTRPGSIPASSSAPPAASSGERAGVLLVLLASAAAVVGLA